MEDITIQKIREIIESIDNKSFLDNFNIELLTRIYREAGEEKLIDFLHEYNYEFHYDKNYSSYNIPGYIYHFIDDLVREEDFQPPFLDPWINAASYFIWRKSKGIHGFCQLEQDMFVLNDLLKTDMSNIKLSDLHLPIQNIESTYDLVVTFLPIADGHTRIYNFITRLLFSLTKCISENGLIIALVPNKFGFDPKAKKLLSKSDLSLQALFHLPEGTLFPTTNVSSYLAVFRKKPVHKVFIAQITPSKEMNSTILNNFRSKTIGENSKLGRLMPFSDFTSFKAIEQSDELERLGSITGFKAGKLVDLCTQIVILNADTKEEITHKSNSIYLPRAGDGPVVEEIHELQKKPRNYFQITLDDTKAISTYLVNYFDTPIGHLALERIKTGISISRINLKRLEDCVVYLPDLAQQIETIGELNKIRSVESDLRDLKTKLWKYPKALSGIKKSLKKYEQKDTFRDWLDTLPFPLSSILWRFQATNSPGKKVEHLLHFFEAFSEFISLLILSSFSQNSELYESEKERWISNNEQYSDWYLKATFGGWNHLVARLSKATRTLFNDKDKKEILRNSFGNPGEEFITLVTSKMLFNTLEEARGYRNKWKGHGGLPSSQEISQRVTILSQVLAKLRKVIGDGFSRSKLISANTCTYSEGIFHYSATELMGNRTPFNEINLKSIKPLDTKSLYFLHEGSYTPVELVPFIKYDQQTRACYFYSSMEGAGVRFISFHFDKNSEITEEINDKFKEVLKMLEKKG